MAEAAYRKGDIVELLITDMADKDECFGKLECGMGVMVGGMLAVGDRVSARVTRVRQRYLKAIAVEVLEPSLDRTEPVCGDFGVCGGCKLMHIRYPAQLRYKEKKVQDALIHIGGFSEPPMLPALGAPSPVHYRNKIEFSCSGKRYLRPEELSMDELLQPKNFALGFHAPGNFEKVIDTARCHLATEEMNSVLRLTRDFALENAMEPYMAREHTGFLRNLVVRSSVHTGEVMVNIVTSWYDGELMESYSAHLQSGMQGVPLTLVNNVTNRRNTVATGDVEYTILGSGTISEKLGLLEFRISANSFFQTNTLQAEALYGRIQDACELRAGDRVYDLYCGTGTITLWLARHAERAIGLEVVESSIQDARSNAESNGIGNAYFFQTDLKDLGAMMEQLEEHGRPDVIVTDPPRAGMHPKALETMLKLGARRIVYVSCNPASLARDGKEIAGAGYRLVSVEPVDMFPHTAHIESVACFDYSASGGGSSE